MRPHGRSTPPWPSRSASGGEPQIHGTQYQVRDGVLELRTVRYPSGPDLRRAAMGPEPEAENRARLLAAEGLTGQPQDEEPSRGG